MCVCPTPLFRIIWTLGFCIASLPTERWVQRALRWKPAGRHVAGHPRHNWTSKFQSCTKHGQIDDWYTLASNKGLWTHLIADFVVFASGQTWWRTTGNLGQFHKFFPSSCAQYELPTGMQDEPWTLNLYVCCIYICLICTYIIGWYCIYLYICNLACFEVAGTSARQTRGQSAAECALIPLCLKEESTIPQTCMAWNAFFFLNTFFEPKWKNAQTKLFEAISF